MHRRKQRLPSSSCWRLLFIGVFCLLQLSQGFNSGLISWEDWDVLGYPQRICKSLSCMQSGFLYLVGEGGNKGRYLLVRDCFAWGRFFPEFFWWVKFSLHHLRGMKGSQCRTDPKEWQVFLHPKYSWNTTSQTYCWKYRSCLLSTRFALSPTEINTPLKYTFEILKG